MNATTDDVSTDDGELLAPGFEIFVGILSILSVVNLVLLYFVADDDLSNVLWMMNALLSAVFIIDVTYRLTTTTDRRNYLLHQYGWADLLASIPLPQVKILRLLRVTRMVRLMRKHGGRRILASILYDRAGSALLTVLLMGILVLEFGSLTVLKAEKGDPAANIQTASDAVWYVLVTMSTVGYGDQFPVTSTGRILGTFVIVIGVGIFGTFTGYLANLFLAPRSEPDPEAIPTDEPDAAVPTTVDVSAATASSDGSAAASLEDLRALVVRQQQALDDMRRLIDTAVPGGGSAT